MSDTESDYEYDPGTHPGHKRKHRGTGKPRGRPNTGAREENQVPHLSWTWNQSDKQIWLPNEFEAFHTVIQNTLETTYGKDVKFIFQLEKGKDAQRLHYQGHIKWNRGKGTRPLTFAAEMKDIMPGIHVTPSSNAGKRAAEDYCMKTDTRIDGPWAETGHIFPDFSEYDQLTHPLYGWLATVRDWCLQPPIARKCIWLHDCTTQHPTGKGNSGKSHFTNYMELNHGFLGLGLSTAADNYYMCANLPATRGYVFDIPRTLPKRVDIDEVYFGLETIKTRNIASTKYKPSKTFLPVIPHVLVFANRRPDLKKCSLDRWIVYQINGDTLTKEYDQDDPTAVGFPEPVIKITDFFE